MPKKIIIVGPPSAGKTTLRKIFFEGENSTKLLSYALEPTHEKESFTVNLGEDIGIYDLGGQDYHRWLDSDEREIFHMANVIIVVINVTTKESEIIEIIKKVIDTRNMLCPLGYIHVLIHKIDLTTQIELNSLKETLSRFILKHYFISISYSSIKSDFIAQTFSSFVNIMKSCLDDKKTIEKLDADLLKISISILNSLNKDVVNRLTDLQIEFNLTKEELNFIANFLNQMGYTHFTDVETKKILGLSEKGRKYITEVLKNASYDKYFDLKRKKMYSETSLDMNIPPFVGFFISDKNGKVWYTVELYKGALKKYLLADSDTERKQPLNIDLIPMFITALEKFSSEINIKDFSGFSLMGNNLKMQIYDMKKYTVTMFMNPNINIKSIEYKLQDYFINLFRKYGKDFDKAIETGFVEPVDQLLGGGKKWLSGLNEEYKHMILNFEFFDFERGRKLFGELEELHEEENAIHSISIEKIKRLKNELISSIVDENLERIVEVAKKMQDFRLKLRS